MGYTMYESKTGRAASPGLSYSPGRNTPYG